MPRKKGKGFASKGAKRANAKTKREKVRRGYKMSLLVFVNKMSRPPHPTERRCTAGSLSGHLRMS